MPSAEGIWPAGRRCPPAGGVLEEPAVVAHGDNRGYDQLTGIRALQATGDQGKALHGNAEHHDIRSGDGAAVVRAPDIALLLEHLQDGFGALLGLICLS